MIQFEFETAIFLYLLVSIFIFLFAWILFSKIKIPSEYVGGLDSIWQCLICTYIYVDSKNEQISKCPRCKSYNERKEKK